MVIPELKGFCRSRLMQNWVVIRAHSLVALIFCCSKLRVLDCHHSSKVTQFLSTSIWCYIHYTVCVSSAVQFCSDSICAFALESLSITPYCPGLPGPCRHPVQHPDDLWSLTCRHPAGCPVVHESQLVG